MRGPPRLLAGLALLALACDPDVMPPSGAPPPSDADALSSDGGPRDAAPEGDAAAEREAVTDGDPGTDVAAPAGGCLQPASLEQVRGWLQRLTGEVPVTLDGQSVTLGERASGQGRARARAFLRVEYEALGYTVADSAYATGVNLIASRPGRGGVPGGPLVIGAHYDTVPGTVGADDNASGLAASLGAALALRGCTLQRELQFIALDEEEKGLLGARAHVGGLRAAGQAAGVLGMLNLDMMGYDADDDGSYTIFECDRPESLFLVDALLAETRALGLPLRPGRQCVGGGDHQAFWDGRIPAIAFGEEYGRAGADVNPCYHEACDRLDRINLAYLTRLTHLTAATISALLSAR